MEGCAECSAGIVGFAVGIALCCIAVAAIIVYEIRKRRVNR